MLTTLSDSCVWPQTLSPKFLTNSNAPNTVNASVVSFRIELYLSYAGSYIEIDHDPKAWSFISRLSSLALGGAKLDQENGHSGMRRRFQEDANLHFIICSTADLQVTAVSHPSVNLLIMTFWIEIGFHTRLLANGQILRNRKDEQNYECKNGEWK